MRYFIFFIVLLLIWNGAAAADSATATVSDSVRANLRSGKTESYRIIRILPPQTQVDILMLEQDYAQVRTADGEVGWLPRRLLNVPESSADVSSVAPETDGLIAAQQALQAAENRLSILQSELDQERGDARTKAIMSTLVITVALLFGVIAGVFLHEIYYRKRLNGLRI